MFLDDAEEINLHIHLVGPSFNHKDDSLKIDLFSFSRTVLDIQSLFDRSFSILNKTDRITKTNRREFKLIAHKLESGSLNIDAMLSLTPTIIPLIAEYIPTAYNIAKTTIEAFELGKKLRKLLQEGHTVQPVTYNNVGTVNNFNIQTVTIANPTTGENIETDLTTYLTAICSSRSHERLLQHMNQENVSGLDLSVQNSDIKMKTSILDKPLFKSQIKIDDTIQKFEVKVHALDTESNSGELRIYEDNKLSKPINFSIIGTQDLKNYSLSLNIDKLTISALPEYKSDLSGRVLVRLHIANIFLPK